MRRSQLAVAAVVFALGLAPVSVRAQMVSATTGAINGQVTDEQGAPLAGATITIYSPTLMGLQTATTNREGRYRFGAKLDW